MMMMMDTIGLQHYDVHYTTTTKTAAVETVCLTTKKQRPKRDADDNNNNNCLQSRVRIYFTGDLLRHHHHHHAPNGVSDSDNVVSTEQLVRCEGIECPHGFPPSKQDQSEFLSHHHQDASTTTTTTTTMRLDASTLRSAVLRFMDEETGELVSDPWNAKGNGIGVQLVNASTASEGGMALLYLLRDNALLLEQPLVLKPSWSPPCSMVTTSTKKRPSPLSPPPPPVFVLDTRMLRSFVALVPPGGERGGGAVVHIACSEDPATGTQRGSLAFRGGTGEGATAASGSGQAVAAFDAFFSVTP